MRKQQTITGFVAVILIAAAATATAATMRSSASATNQIAPTGSISIEELAVNVNKLPIEEFDDMSLVYSTKTGH